MSTHEVPLPVVTRMSVGGRCRIEPPLDPAGSEIEMLAWWTALTNHDTNSHLALIIGTVELPGADGEWIAARGHYAIRHGRKLHLIGGFDATRYWLSGFAAALGAPAESPTRSAVVAGAD